MAKQSWLRRVAGLWQVSGRRNESHRHYVEFQAFQARWLIDYMAERGVTLAGKVMLDLGSGPGGYTLEFARAGARVLSLDLVQKPQPVEDPTRPLQLRGDALRTPLRSESVQIVFCASLIEHVAAPARLLAEIERILTPRGEAYISFPPYYSPMGGHEFAPYHYLGERAALRLTRRRRVLAEWARDLNGAKEEATSFADLYAGWGLFRMTVGKMRRLVAASGFDCLDISTRYLPYSFIRWPVLGEALTWHAQFLLRKR